MNVNLDGMTFKDGISLTEFLNTNNSRFAARVLSFGGGCWVIAVDTDVPGKDGHLEPVVNINEYILRAQFGKLNLPPEFTNLLEAWFIQQPNSHKSGQVSV